MRNIIKSPAELHSEGRCAVFILLLYLSRGSLNTMLCVYMRLCVNALECVYSVVVITTNNLLQPRTAPSAEQFQQVLLLVKLMRSENKIIMQ